MNRCPGRNSASRLAFPACLRSAPGLVAPMGVAVLRYSQGRGAGQAGLLQTLPCTPVARLPDLRGRSPSSRAGRPPASRLYGVAIFQRPRPCVAAMMYEPSGLSWRSFTDACGRVPRRDHVVALPWPADAIKTPMSVATTTLPLFVVTMSSPGASGSAVEPLPLMSVQVWPPSFVSKTWPSPALKVLVQRRENPLKTTYAWLTFAGSTKRPWMNRFGNDAGRLSWCTVPPAFVRIPRWNPELLHGPHHAAYHVPFAIDSWVTEWPEPLLPTMCQSQDLEPQVVFQPWVSSHTYWPPATHVVGFVWSASNGATNRGAGSHGLGVYVNAEQAGEISR